jgi:hypothetical protein
MGVSRGLSALGLNKELQSLINRCLRLIYCIWWPGVMSNDKLWKENNKECQLK